MTTPTIPPITPRALPRRANRIRALAADMASIKLRETNARQAVSDRIGYAIAVVGGAAAYHFGGTRAVEGVVLLYAIAASMAHARYRRLKEARR